MWDKITYPFPNFNSFNVEIWQWISNFISHFTGHGQQECTDFTYTKAWLLMTWNYDKLPWNYSYEHMHYSCLWTAGCGVYMHVMGVNVSELAHWQLAISQWSGLAIQLVEIQSSMLTRWPPSDAIWWQRSGSTLAQVMACCLTAPSHYLNQRWLIISKVQWHSSVCNFTRDAPAISHWN